MTAKAASFKKAERLTNTKEYRVVLRNGAVLRKKWLALYYLPNNNQSQSRLGIVISRHSLRQASDRNLAKRVIREFFRLHKSKFHINFSVVVRAISNCKVLSRNELREMLEGLFHEAGILSG